MIALMELVAVLLAIVLAVMPVLAPFVEYVLLDFALDLYPDLAVQLLAGPVVWVEQQSIVAVVGTEAAAVVALFGLVLGPVLLALAWDQAAQPLEHVLVIDAKALPWPLDSVLLQSMLLEQHVLGTVGQMAEAQYPLVSVQWTQTMLTSVLYLVGAMVAASLVGAPSPLLEPCCSVSCSLDGEEESLLLLSFEDLCSSSLFFDRDLRSSSDESRLRLADLEPLRDLDLRRLECLCLRDRDPLDDGDLRSSSELSEEDEWSLGDRFLRRVSRPDRCSCL